MILTTCSQARCFADDSSRVSSMVKQIILEKLPPAGFTREFIEGMFRKALRRRLWGLLKPEERALILVLRRWVGRVKSLILRSVLEGIYVKIELNTFRGRALFYGVLLAVRSGLLEALNSVKLLLCLGISYLNNPPLFRFLE